MDRLQSMFDKFKRDLDKYPVLQTAQQKTGVPKVYLVAGGGAVFVLFLFFGFGAGLLCNLVGFLYPAYCSFLAIESEGTNDDTQWLTYWVVYAAFSILEIFAETLLYWIPFYYAFKLAFLVWCMLPATHGAAFIYDNFLKDFLKTHESKIDAAISGTAQSAKNAANDAQGAASKFKDT